MAEELDQLPKHLLWRLVDRFERHDRNLDADDQFVMLGDVEAFMADAARQLAQVTAERDELKMGKGPLFRMAALTLRAEQAEQERDTLKQRLHVLTESDRAWQAATGKRAIEAEAQLAALQRAICGEAPITEHHAILALAEAHRADSELVDRQVEHRVHEDCHDLVCNGNRAYPRGFKGHGCSCASRAIRDAEALTQAAALRAALEQLVAFWRVQAAAGDTEEECFKTECANDLQALLTAPPQEPKA